MIHSAEIYSLTGESTPAGNIAGSTVGQDDVPVWEAGGHDCVREGDRGRQLDEGDVVTAKGRTIIPIQEVMTSKTWFMLY